MADCREPGSRSEPLSSSEETTEGSVSCKEYYGYSVRMDLNEKREGTDTS